MEIKHCWRSWPNVGKGLRHLFQLLLSNLAGNCLLCICPFAPRRGFTFPLPGAAEAAEFALCVAECNSSLSAEPAELQEHQGWWGCSPAPPNLCWWGVGNLTRPPLQGAGVELWVSPAELSLKPGVIKNSCLALRNCLGLFQAKLSRGKSGAAAYWI